LRWFANPLLLYYVDDLIEAFVRLMDTRHSLFLTDRQLELGLANASTKAPAGRNYSWRRLPSIAVSVLRSIRNNSLVSGSSIYLASNILNAGIPFVLLPVLTQYLSPSEYGQVAMFMSLIAALGAVIGLNTVGAANRKVYDRELDKIEMSLFIGGCLQILAVSGTLVFLIMWAFQDRLSAWIGLQAHWLLWAVVASAAGFIIKLRLGQWLVRKQARLYGSYQVSQSLLNMLASLLLVVGFMLGPTGRMTGFLIANLSFAVLALIFLARDGLFRVAWKPAHIKEALVFGVPLIPHATGLFLLTAVDRIVINTELGLAETGIYNVAAQFAAALGIIFDAVNKAFVPWLYERLKRNRLSEKRHIVRLTYTYFAIALLMAAFMFLLGPLAIRLVAGLQYAEAGEVIGWIALGQTFKGMYLMVTNYVFYSKKTGLLSLATISSGLLNIVLLVALVKLLGLVGAGMAFALAMAIRFLLTWRVAQLRYPMPWFSASPSRAI
jgi:O-antigen/teichoic acid export membrane protein